MSELKEVFEMVTKQTEPDLDSWNQQEERRRRRARNRKIGALAVVGVIAAIVAFVAVASVQDRPTDRTGGVGPNPSVEPQTAPDTDFTVDLTSGDIEPLAPSILEVATEIGGFSVSPVGEVIAFNGTDAEGNTQVFLANLDGSGVHQLTHRSDGAIFPTWSPDGSRIAYAAPESGDQNVFVLSAGGGRSTQVTHEECCFLGTFQIAPDGDSVIYTIDRGDGNGGRVRIVPISGGKSNLLVAPEAGDAGDGTVSPDARYVSYGGNELVGGPANRWLADVDGTNPRLLVEGNFPSATWSPDSTRLAYWSFPEHEVFVIDIASGESSKVADGAWPVWLDDHTLIVEPDSGL